MSWLLLGNYVRRNWVAFAGPALLVAVLAFHLDPVAEARREGREAGRFF